MSTKRGLTDEVRWLRSENARLVAHAEALEAVIEAAWALCPGCGGQQYITDGPHNQVRSFCPICRPVREASHRAALTGPGEGSEPRTDQQSSAGRGDGHLSGTEPSHVPSPDPVALTGPGEPEDGDTIDDHLRRAYERDRAGTVDPLLAQPQLCVHGTQWPCAECGESGPRSSAGPGEPERLERMAKGYEEQAAEDLEIAQSMTGHTAQPTPSEGNPE